MNGPEESMPEIHTSFTMVFINLHVSIDSQQH